MKAGASAPYSGEMKRRAIAVVLVVGAVAIAGSSAAVQPKVTRAQDERTTDVALEWTGFSPHARIRVAGGPVGGPASGYYRGPAEGWLAADGGPPEGVGSVRPPRGHHILPLRSTSIPVSLVSALARNGALLSLAPPRSGCKVSGSCGSEGEAAGECSSRGWR
jgi:hypothetical protein